MMRKRATMHDVAALAGVSLKTVSRVVNREESVSEALAQRVQRAVAQLDYRHNLAASNLRRGQRTSSIGVLLHDLSNSFSATLLRAIEDRARSRRIAVFSASLDDQVEREPLLAHDLVSRRIDGLVIMPAGGDQSYLQVDIRAGLGVVAVDRPAHGVDVDTVLADNYGGARAAALHLAAAGHRRIACLTDLDSIWTATERRRGFVDAVAETGQPLDGRLVVGNISGEQAAEEAVTRLLQRAEPPTALFTGQNAITVGAIRALSRLGLQDQVAIVGFDDFPLSDVVRPAVTVIRQDVAAMGGVVADLLLAQLDGEAAPPQRHVQPNGLIVRGSGEIGPAVGAPVLSRLSPMS